jgi:hypothetical protein
MAKQTTLRLPEVFAEAIARVMGTRVNALTVESLSTEIAPVSADEVTGMSAEVLAVAGSINVADLALHAPMPASVICSPKRDTCCSGRLVLWVIQPHSNSMAMWPPSPTTDPTL